MPARLVTYLMPQVEGLAVAQQAWERFVGQTEFAGTTVLAVLLAPIAAALLNLVGGWWVARKGAD